MCMLKITDCGKTLIFLRLLREALDLDLWVCVESYVLCTFVGRVMCHVLASVWRDVCGVLVQSFHFSVLSTLISAGQWRLLG